MANEFKHKSAGLVLTQIEDDEVGRHIFNSQATGDIMYASSATQLSRLAKGADNTILAMGATIPEWKTPATILADISPLTTRGDIMYRNATISTRLAKGTANTVLVMGADDPAWSATLSGLTFVAPILGAATATSINKITLTQPATGATLTLVEGSSLITAGAYAVTLTATATTGITLPTTGTLATLAGAEALTAKTGFNGLVVTPNTGTITTGVWSGTTIAVNKGGTGVTASTGTVAVVLSTSPTLVTPILGVASATSLATSAATPLIMTQGAIVNIALTSQTVGATTLTIPDFASVVDEFTFKTKAQTMANKTLTSPTINGTIATTGLTLPAFTFGGAVDANGQTLSNVFSISMNNRSIFRAVDNDEINLCGGLTVDSGSALILNGEDSSGGLTYQSRNAAKNGTLGRLAITGNLDIAVATWANITHTYIKLTGAASAFGAIVLPTGAGKTVDQVITELQNLGLVTQA